MPFAQKVGSLHKKSQMNHSEVFIKVNAPCDKGIAPLVTALNEIHGLVTVDSCQNGPWGAYVFFTYGKTWKELAALLQKISNGLSNPGLPVGFTLTLEWLGSNNKPRARIALEPEHVVVVAEALRKLAPNLNARMTA